jgi:hypothetical protein
MSFIFHYPPVTQYVAIFDTNVYRDLCPGQTEPEIIATVSALRTAEASNGIVGVGLVIAAIELISGMVEGEGTKSYRECLSGIIAMAHHVHHDESNQPIIIPHPYLHLARSFFGETPAHIFLQVQQVGGVIFDFKKDVAAALNWHSAKNTFQQAKTWLLGGEMDFVDLIENLIAGAEVEVREKYPKADARSFRQKMTEYLMGDAFKNIVAQQILIATAGTLTKGFSAEEINARVQSLLDSWPLAVGFMTWVCYTIHIRNIDMHSKASMGTRWNWVWDYHAVFLISKDTLNGRVPFIVTGDTDMQNALSDHGFKDRVMTLNEYKQRLEFQNKV